MNYVLTGAGHLGFGFILGALIVVFLMMIFKRSLGVRLYAPFLPFFLGVLASLPYTFYDKSTCDISFLMNIFVLYPLAHCNHIIIKLLGNLHIVAVIFGVIYILVLLYYISLIKRLRKSGWNSRRARA